MIHKIADNLRKNDNIPGRSAMTWRAATKWSGSITREMVAGSRTIIAASTESGKFNPASAARAILASVLSGDILPDGTVKEGAAIAVPSDPRRK